MAARVGCITALLYAAIQALYKSTRIFSFMHDCELYDSGCDIDFMNVMTYQAVNSEL